MAMLWPSPGVFQAYYFPIEKSACFSSLYLDIDGVLENGERKITSFSIYQHGNELFLQACHTPENICLAITMLLRSTIHQYTLLAVPDNVELILDLEREVCERIIVRDISGGIEFEAEIMEL